jgi:hypothetical protein
MTKPGYKTTEFWVALLVIVGSFLSTLAGSLPDRYAALASSVAGGLYALSRGLAKIGTPPVDQPTPPPTP